MRAGLTGAPLGVGGILFAAPKAVDELVPLLMVVGSSSCVSSQISSTFTYAWLLWKSTSPVPGPLAGFLSAEGNSTSRSFPLPFPAA